ncbi:hypothetical protein GCM10027265_01060 [Jatrophihabitans fulvus]
MNKSAVKALRKHGVTVPKTWRSQQITPGLLKSSDLVLTATRAHLVKVLTLHPASLRRTFVLGEFCDFLVAGGDADDKSNTIEDLVLRARRGRATIRGDRAPVSHDIADPINGTSADFESCANQIDGFLRTILGDA